MASLLNKDFRQELLRMDIVPRNLNDVSKKYKEMLIQDFKNRVIKTEVVKTCQCGSENLEELTKIDRFGLLFGSLICKQCGLVITNPRISEESLPYYYDKYYHPLNYGREYIRKENVAFARGQGKKIFNILKSFLPNKKEFMVLEIGAGTGNVLFEFREEAKKENITVKELGTEYSEDCILSCKEKNINVIQGNSETVLNLKKEESKYDIIILSHVFEHFIDLNYELILLKKLMHNETLLYIEVPGIMAIHKSKWYNFSFLGYSIHAHMYNFTKESLNNILLSNGFNSVFLNDEVESVFKIGMNKNVKINNAYIKILNYLEFIDNNNSYFKQEIQRITNLSRWHNLEKEKRIKLERWHNLEKEKRIKHEHLHNIEKKTKDNIIEQYNYFKKSGITKKYKELKKLFEIIKKA